MKLYLMRHGEALNKEVDPQRGLSKQGKVAILHIARKLAARGVHPDKIIHSSKARAQQTAELVKDVVAREIVCNESSNIKPNDDPGMILNSIRNETVDTLMVSHLPFIPDLLQLLCPMGESVIFAPGTVVCLEKNDPDWIQLWVENTDS